MTSFGWKRKAGPKISGPVSKAFGNSAADDEEDAAVASGDVDWLTLAPQKRAMVLEDAIAKSNRLKQEGVTLAEADRYWEALRKWDQALQLTPNCEKLMEMKAQAYMQLHELYPALNAAEKAVELSPCWWVGHQTLGRARLGLGEVRMAIKCFSRAIHLNPTDEELWNEDLRWSAELLAKKRIIEEQALLAAENEQTSKIVELDSENVPEGTSQKELVPVQTVTAPRTEDEGGGCTCTSAVGHSSTSSSTPKLPENYVYMID